MTEETKKVVEQLRNYICGARCAAYHNATPDYDEDLDLDYTRGLLDGYKEGLHNGYEGALGILETVEGQLEYNILDDEEDEIPFDECDLEDESECCDCCEDYDCDPYEDAKADVIAEILDIISVEEKSIDNDDVKEKCKNYAKDVVDRIRTEITKMQSC